MKHEIWTIIGIALLVTALFFLLGDKTKDFSKEPASESMVVQQLVLGFGNHLKNVSLTAPIEILTESITREYTPYVSPLLLERFIADPLHAPGRLTSSPWPEKIEIKQAQLMGDYWEVFGDVVFMTSADIESGGEAGREPFFITVANIQGKWLIAEYQGSME